jgi:hypothetical protein
MNPALAQIILQLLPTITTGARELWAFVAKTRIAAQQSGEWSHEAEVAYQAEVLRTATDPAWQPDQPAT